MGVSIADAVAQEESRAKAVVKNGSQDLTEQTLNSCFQRFVPVSDEGDTQIRYEDFYECIRVIGRLLTRPEMDRLVERAFGVYAKGGAGGTLAYDEFVRSTRRSSTGGHSDGGRYCDVARAVVRYCASMHASWSLKLTHLCFTLDPFNNSSSTAKIQDLFAPRN